MVNGVIEIFVSVVLIKSYIGVSPDKTPRRSKYVSGSVGNGGQGENAGEGATQNETSETMEERLSKLMEEKLQNNGTRNEAGKFEEI